MSGTSVTIHFHQRFGAVDRIVSLLRRRGFPIAAMTLERTHSPQVGRMTVHVEADALEQMIRHVRRLADVISVSTVEGDGVCREYALVRVRCAPDQRQEVLALLSTVAGRAITMTTNHVVLEAAGSPATLDRLFATLAPYGIEESARTGPMALRDVSDDAGRQSA